MCVLCRQYSLADLLRYPHPDILFAESGCHQVRKLVGRAGKGGYTQFGQEGGMGLVVSGGTVIVQVDGGLVRIFSAALAVSHTARSLQASNTHLPGLASPLPAFTEAASGASCMICSSVRFNGIRFERFGVRLVRIQMYEKMPKLEGLLCKKMLPGYGDDTGPDV